jgi:hypothetical protein
MTLRGTVAMMARTPDYILDWVGRVPTTNVRILTTLFCMLLTAGRYVASQTKGGWEPSVEWLAFLVAMAGVDAAQFLAKRTTDARYVDARNPSPPPGGTVSAAG